MSTHIKSTKARGARFINLNQYDFIVEFLVGISSTWYYSTYIYIYTHYIYICGLFSVLGKRDFVARKAVKTMFLVSWFRVPVPCPRLVLRLVTLSEP